MAPATAPAFAALCFHEVPLNRLTPSSLNPRKVVGDVTDLAASIREVGILEPILVRPMGMLADGPLYEVVAGSRRHAAAIVAGLLMVPVLVRPLTDTQALELAIIENNQRGDIHPLDEADAFAKLRTLDRAYTPEVVAAKIGRPLAYVKGRLRLLGLDGEAREAFAADQITIGHADRLARLAPTLQERALDACFSPLFGREEGAMGLAAISALENWITEHTVIDVKSPETQEELPELVAQVDLLEAEGATIVQLSTSYQKTHGLSGKAAPLPMGAWVEVTGKPCKCLTKGVVVYGERHRAQILDVCLKASKCQTHWKAARATPSRTGKAPQKDSYEIQRERQEADRKAWDAVAPHAIAAIAATLKGRKIDLAYFLAVTDPRDRERVTTHLGDVTEKNLGQALWLHEVLRCSTWHPEQFTKDVKDLIAFDVVAWRKQWAKDHPTAAPAPVAATKATPAKVKKAATTR
jgi:ParB/RepB/Spo0J family partition protein